ncbi:MAG: MBL fold metallo-hydrolase [Deltaproteobacteria bacterium]|nr:MBL fold metallo-hydrolase [Deltaproteobacteria bacterium]
MIQIRKVTPLEGVHKITIPIPFPIEDVNVYLLEGSPLTLIDTGLRSTATMDALERALSGIGRKLRDVERILVTHGHIDHFGAARTLSEISGAKVFVHAFDVNKVNHDFLQDFDREPSRLALYLIEAGVPANYYPFLKQEFLTNIHDYSEPLTRVELMADEDEIEAGGRKLQVMHFPGHCIGQVCFFDPEEQLMFTGDHVLPEITPNPVMDLIAREEFGYQSLKTYLESLRSTRNVDVRHTLPGHGEPFGPLQARVDEIIRHHEQRKNEIVRILNNGSKTKWQICGKLFSQLEQREAFLGLSEVDGHLELLEEAGQVTCEKVKDSLLFHLH